MQPTEPQAVKMIAAILFSDSDLLDQAVSESEQLFDPVDYRSDQFLFDVTDYYEEEMGSPIYRQFVSYTSLGNPGNLADWKIATNQLEDRLAMDGSRRVNIDIGYLDYHKFVLASAKYNGQKIYLGKGIYADPTLYYRKGSFHPYDWSFPDFKANDRYYDALLAIRQLYKAQLQEMEAGTLSAKADN